MHIRTNNINELYRSACLWLLEHHDYVCTPRGQKVYEVLDAKLILENPRNRIVTIEARNLSLRYLAGELAFYFSGSDELSFISHYSKFWNNISDNGKTVNSCYGKKLFYDKNTYNISQFDYALEQLKQDKDSRKAVMLIHGKQDAILGTKDNICTLSLQFFIRNNKLHLITTMRSNDVWFGLPYDIAFFTIVQELMWFYLKNIYKGLELGTYTHNCGSLHLYEKDFEKADDVAYTGKRDFEFSKKQLPELDCGLFGDGAIQFKSNERYKRTGGGMYHQKIKSKFFSKLAEWLEEK